MKILVISHNVFSDNSSMGRTLSSFFTTSSADSIAQLYFHSEEPTTNVSNTYFRITDFDNLKAKKNIGKIFNENDIKHDLKTSRVDTGAKTHIYNIGKKKKPYMYIGRNLIWSTNKWKNKKLFNWVDDFNPDIIFFASGDYVFAYKIAMAIAKYKNIPILTYVCDDYYFLKRRSFSPLYYLNKFYFKHTMKKLFKHNKNMIAICDKASKDYSKEFGVNSETIMTSSKLHSTEYSTPNKNTVISYIGNMGYNRHKILIKIGNVLSKMPSDIKLDIYSGETRSDIIEELKKCDGINYHGSLSYDEVIKAMQKSDILIHVESMDNESRNKVRYSVSTKIADSLSMGKCLLAYGPSDVASIEYLKDNDCACVVTKDDDLAFALQELITDKNFREKYEVNALNTAKKYHNSEINCKKFKEIISNMVNTRNK